MNKIFYKVLSVSSLDHITEEERLNIFRFEDSFDSCPIRELIGKVISFNTDERYITFEITEDHLDSDTLFSAMVGFINEAREKNFYKNLYQIPISQPLFETPNFATLNKTGENEMKYKVTVKQVKKQIEATSEILLANVDAMSVSIQQRNFDQLESQLQVCKKLQSRLSFLEKLTSAQEVYMDEVEYTNFVGE